MRRLPHRHGPRDRFAGEVTSTDQFTNDPHSVHRDVVAREGCIRCHAYDDTTFYTDDPGMSGFQQNVSVSTQGNASRSSYGVSNPINMTRTWDNDTLNGPVFLSTVDEANYSYSAGGGGLSSTGSGWAVYGRAETGRSSQYSCTDCHDQFHAEQGFADTGGYGLEFAFNDTAGSRKGPYTPVDDSESVGVTVGGRNVTCGECHPTDTHAVHTNGAIVSTANYSQVSTGHDQTMFADVESDPSGGSILGAELCDECHTQNLDVHWSSTRKARGLAGVHDPGPGPKSHNRYPDLGSPSYDLSVPADCGFCHHIGAND